MARRKITGRVRVSIDFPNPDAALEFVDGLRRGDPEGMRGVDLFQMDGLDDQKGGITPANTFLVKRGRDRIPGSSLRELIGLERLPRTEFGSGDGPADKEEVHQ
jgi:hypothetical protein